MTRPPLRVVPTLGPIEQARARIVEMVDCILDEEARLPGLLDNRDVGYLRAIRRRVESYVTRPDESGQ